MRLRPMANSPAVIAFFLFPDLSLGWLAPVYIHLVFSTLGRFDVFVWSQGGGMEGARKRPELEGVVLDAVYLHTLSVG